MNGKKVLAWVAGGVLIGGGIYLFVTAWKKHKSTVPGDLSAPTTPDPITSAVKTVLSQKDDSFPLNIGSKGSNVEYLQKALNKLGAGLSVDGTFGQKTYTAVVTKAGSKFWTPEGITIDGFNKILSMANSMGATTPVTSSYNTTLGL